MKLSRTTEYNFGWLVLLALVDVSFLLVFFLLLISNFILQPGISVAMPFSRFTLGPLLDATKREGHSIIVKADHLAPYETVIEVTNAALEHGITSVALATSSP